MDTNRFCSTCGLELPGTELGGRCPHCLLRLALPDANGSGGARHDCLPPINRRFFGSYEIIEEISRGGMGVVYKARQLQINRLVALKMIQSGHLASAEAHLRFRMEAEAVARLDHPHIVSLHETGEVNGIHFYSMNLVEGETLAARMARSSSPIANRENIRLLAQVCRAVHYAHQRGVLHRDLKPSNILIDARGEPHVADFGLAKMLEHDSGLTYTESVLGSPNYMAPEQAQGHSRQISTAADIYGLGAILYELLTGHPPFQAETAIETVRLVTAEEPKPPRKVRPRADADLETICLKCLQKEPGARYGSAEALAEDLERWLNGLPIRARPPGFLGTIWRWSRRHRAVALLGLSLILALGAGAASVAIAAVRISHAERQAKTYLREALLGQARALRLSAGLGRRAEGFHLIRQAAALGGSDEFRRQARDEWLALAARTDMIFNGDPGWPHSPDPELNLFDPGFERVASIIEQTNLVITRLTDQRELRRFSLGDSPVRRLERFSPDGRFLAARHADGLSVWDVESGELCLRMDGAERAFCFASGTPLLVIEKKQRELLFLELPAARELRRLPVQPDILGRRSSWQLLALSPDGRMLAAARTSSRLVELIDAHTGAPILALTNSSRLRALAWHPKSTQVAVASADGRVAAWIAATGRRHFLLPAAPAPAHSLAFNPAGTLLAAGGEDQCVRMIDLFALRYACEFRSDSHALGFTPDGVRVGPAFRGSELGWLELIHPSEFFEMTVADMSMRLTGCQFSPDSRIVATGGDTNIVLLNLSDGRRLESLSGWRLSAFAFDPQGEMILGAGTPGLFRWKTPSPRLAALSDAKGENLFAGRGWRAFTFSPEGAWFVAANIHSNAAYLFDRSLNRVAEVGPHAAADSVAISPGADWIATGSTTDRRVKVWDAMSGAEMFHRAVGAAPKAAFSANGKWLATFGGAFALHETGSWKTRALPVPDGQPLWGAAAFSPDGRLLAVVSDLFDVQLFDLEKFQPAGLLRAPSQVRINALAFTPDGKRLAAACDSARLRIWDLDRIRQGLGELGLDWD
jgi:eukaryotic-like serine/threonine-protein kinase